MKPSSLYVVKSFGSRDIPKLPHDCRAEPLKVEDEFCQDLEQLKPHASIRNKAGLIET